MASQNSVPVTDGSLKDKPSSSQGGLKEGISVTTRLRKDLQSLMLSGNRSISAFPVDDNLLHWVATITGGKGTVYDGLTYKLSLDFPSRYPYVAPVVKFITPCYHPNVDSHGNICLDILKEEWSALMDVRTVLLSIQSLLGEPNVNSPLNVEAAELWESKDEYKKVLLQKYKLATKGDGV